MREGRATHDRRDAGGRAAPGAAAEEQLPSQNVTKKSCRFSIVSVRSRFQLPFLGLGVATENHAFLQRQGAYHK